MQKNQESDLMQMRLSLLYCQVVDSVHDRQPYGCTFHVILFLKEMQFRLSDIFSITAVLVYK